MGERNTVMQVIERMAEYYNVQEVLFGNILS
jgi:hypothetical protein